MSANPIRPTSKDSLRCDSVDSDLYMEISSAPEPLRLLNRYRELCRIFRVSRANSFVCKLLLRHAWAEIHNQLSVIRSRRKIMERKAAQQRAFASGGGGSSSTGVLGSKSPSAWWADESADGAAAAGGGARPRARVFAPGEDSGSPSASAAPFSSSNNNNNNNADFEQEDGEDHHQQQQEDEEYEVPFTVTGETPKPRSAIEDEQIMQDNLKQQQLNSASSLGKDQAGLPMYLPYAWRDSLSKLDFSRTYLGPRGIVAVCALVAEMPWVTELDLSYGAWFLCDERPNFCPTGEEVLRAVVVLLAAHPSLEVLRLDGNMFTTASYVWFLELCKRSANYPLRDISLSGTLLEQFQSEHVTGVLARNALRRRKYSAAQAERSSFVTSYANQSSSQQQQQAKENESTTTSNNNNKESSSPTRDLIVTGSAAAKQVLASGATTHRRGWNYLVSFVTAHPETLRWSVLVARELSVSVSSAAGTLGTLVPAAASSSSSSSSISSPTSRRAATRESSGRPVSPRHSVASAQSQRSVPHPSSQSLVYVMSGLSPNVMPTGATRDAVIAHPFTAETCRFQLSPALQVSLEAVMKCSPLLSQLDDSGRLELMQRGRVVKRTSRSIVMETGDPVDFLYVVLHGGLEIRGRPQVLTAASASAVAAMAASQEGAAASSSSSSATTNRFASSSSSAANGGNPQQRDNVQQYFASPTIYPAGAVVGGEELISPHITQNERRVATFIAAPCCVLPPVLCRRSLVRQSISIDPSKADSVLSNLPLVDACYDDEKLLARANQELEYATAQMQPPGSPLRNRSDSGVFALSGMSKMLAQSMSGGNFEGGGGGGSGGGMGGKNSSSNVSLSSTADVYRGEKSVTVDNDDETLEMEAADGGALRLERLRQLYGVQSGNSLRKIEHDTHASRIYNSHEMRQEIVEKQQQQKHVGDDFKNDHETLTVLLLIPRDAFVNTLLSQVREQRRLWASFLDSLPSLVTLPTAFKLSLSDCIRRRQYTQGEIVSAGFPLLDLMFVVVEGQASIYYQRSEVKRLGRGDIFACHPKTDVSRVSIVVTSAGASTSAGGAGGLSLLARRSSTTSGGGGGGGGSSSVSQLVLGVIAPTFAATLPIGLQRFLMKMRRVYSMQADPHVAHPDGS